jgi:hypothetical protein
VALSHRCNDDALSKTSASPIVDRVEAMTDARERELRLLEALRELKFIAADRHRLPRESPSYDTAVGREAKLVSRIRTLVVEARRSD